MALELYSYQVDAIKRLKTGSILCGGVGSGKSRTSLAYFYFKVCKGRLKLVEVNPDTNEKQELLSRYKKAERPKDLYIITTAKKRDDMEWEDEAIPFLFDKSGINLKIDSWNNITKYSEVKDAFFIFDEQRVIGSGAWVKAFIKISKKNDWILASATPGDTWLDYIPVFVANGFYKNRTEFLRTHVVYSRYVKFPKVDRYLATGRLLKYRNSILVDMDYKKKSVPHNEKIFADYDQAAVRAIMRTRWDPFDNEPIQSVSKYCYILRKIVNSSEGRRKTLKKLLEFNDKAIIFYNYNYELDILREIAKEMGIKHAEWNGSKHQKVPTGNKWLYFVQYNSGSEGWNCTTTNVIIFYSQSYSYRMMIQASGRIDRVNTPFKDLYYYHILSHSKIDKEISIALAKKKNFNEKASSFGKDISMKAKVPCLNCKDRKVGCHSNCEKYKEYNLLHNKDMESIRNKKKIDNDVADIWYSKKKR